MVPLGELSVEEISPPLVWEWGFNRNPHKLFCQNLSHFHFKYIYFSHFCWCFFYFLFRGIANIHLLKGVHVF